MARQNIFDNDIFFDGYSKIRERKNNANELFEKPALFSLLPPLEGKTVIDLGCGYGEHCMEYVRRGAAKVVGIDISEKMLGYARENNSAPNITYRQMAFEDLDRLNERFDVITSSLAFDYVEDFSKLMKVIYGLLDKNGVCVFSMSHPIATAYDGVYDRYTRTAEGERLYANLHNYGIEGVRHIHWIVDDYEVYHRKLSTLINDIAGAGFTIEECQESKLADKMIKEHPDVFGGVIHQPDFIFFRCRK